MRYEHPISKIVRSCRPVMLVISRLVTALRRQQTTEYDKHAQNVLRSHHQVRITGIVFRLMLLNLGLFLIF